MKCCSISSPLLLRFLLLLSLTCSSDAWSNVQISSHNKLQTTPLLTTTTTTTSSRHGQSSSTCLNLAVLNEVASSYSYVLKNYHYVADSATTGLLCGTADIMAQARERFFGQMRNDPPVVEKEVLPEPKGKEEESSSLLDLGRCARFALKGLGGGIIWSTWYGTVNDWSLAVSHDVLDHFSLLAWCQTDMAQQATRVAVSILLEQFVACPLVYGLWDIPVPLLLNGTPPKDVPAQVKSKIGPLLVDNAKVWTLVNIAIYSMPLEYRVLSMGTADVFWQSVVASVASEEAELDDDEMEQNNISPSSKTAMKTTNLSLEPRMFEKENVEEISSRVRR